jgi:hypothetical protein
MTSQLDIDISLDNRIRDINLQLTVLREEYETKIKKIADKLPYPTPNYHPSMAKLIYRAMIRDETLFYIIYGPLRYGKTSYCFKTLASLYNTWEPEVLRKFTVFKPIEFKDNIGPLIKSGVKYPAFLWEDAGIWLNAMDWHDPMLRSIIEFFQVIGTSFAAVLFTSPLPTYIITKLRSLPNCANIRIYKINDNPNKPRTAKGYYQWIAPDLKKTGVRPFIEDKFSAVMPTKFYDWYYPYRKSYLTESYEKLEAAVYARAEEELSKGEVPKASSKDNVSESIEEIADEVL